MNLIRDNFNTGMPIPTIYPEEWSKVLSGSDSVIFNNLDHFIFTVSKLKQVDDTKCGISYKESLEKLINRQSDITEEKQESIRNLVRKNLLKRGLITEEVYENFKYSTDGTQVGVDVGKYAAGDAECVITPTRQYVDYFYELYVSVSYSCTVSDSSVLENVAKLLATVEELERQRVFIKINTVLPIKNLARVDGAERNFFSCIPIFSHKDFKSVSVMSSVINERLLRKFYFGILEELYGEDLKPSYGYAVSLPKTMNIGSSFDEIDVFKNILNSVGAV